jgi:hypothetical protein
MTEQPGISGEAYAAGPASADWVLDARLARRRSRRRINTRVVSLVGSLAVHAMILALGATVVWQAGVLSTTHGPDVAIEFEAPGDVAPIRGLEQAAVPEREGSTSTGEITGLGREGEAVGGRTPEQPQITELAGLSTVQTNDTEAGPRSLAEFSRSSTPSGLFSAFSGESTDELGDGAGIGMATPGVTTGPATVAFAGLGASSVRSVAYVVDASGPMVTSLPMVLRELERSISKLSPTQKFGVIVFRRQSDRGPAAEAFAPVLVRATPSARQMLHDWLMKIEPGGRSSPLAGLEAALAMKPDAVFLLSRSIQRSGGGVWELGMEQTLARLEKLNAIDVDTARRPVLIQTIQFLDEDTTGIMQAIGVRHGGGEGYRVVRRQQDLSGARAESAGEQSAQADR